MENKEPSRNDTAEQEARGEEDKEKAEQFLESYRQRKILAINPSLFLGMLTAYLFFIAGIGAFGVLAYYSNHRTTLEVSFVVSGVLLLLAPASAVWYLFYIRSKKKAEGKEKLLLRITRSSLGGLLVRFGNSRVIRILVYVVYLVSITLFVIVVFPKSPRIALLLIAFYILYLVGLTISLVAALIEKNHKKDKTMLAEAIIATYERLKIQEAETRRFAETTAKYIDSTAASDSEIHKHLITAIEETNRSVHDLHTFTTHLATKLPVDSTTTPGQLDDPKAEEHKETEPPIDSISNQDTREEK